MVATPAVTPQALPVLLIVATVVLLLLHVPPAVASLSSVHEPSQTSNVPSIAVIGFTVTTVVMEQPVGNVYVIVAVPPATPPTTPVTRSTVATEVGVLVHVPPPASVNGVVEPWQTVVTPLIAAGNGFTVIMVVAKQPVAAIL
jgi:hypothetical protein